ncbi:MAG: right-handed parallel beta-helix repeat-containing protein, partial [Proteobacteria bacterium]|nr:right-handed parallel beta-helix repeat-containing protein [Pseudomonadota bacterium]
PFRADDWLLYATGGVAAVQFGDFYAFDGSGSGAGVALILSSPTLINCIISENRLSMGNIAGISGPGGAVACFQSSPTIINCTFSMNSAGSGGGGVYCRFGSSPTIVNSIFTMNWKYAIFEADPESNPVVSYCLFYVNYDGDYLDAETMSYTGGEAINANVAGASNNLDGNPMFVDEEAGDYHLTVGSAALDRGDPDTALTSDLEGNPRPVDVLGSGRERTGTEYDIGAYEYQPRVNGVSDWPLYR